MRRAWIVALCAGLGVSPTSAQLRGAVRIERATPLCSALEAELRAIGVSVVPHGPAALTVVCGEEQLMIRDGSREHTLSGADEVLAARGAERIRARLLTIAPPIEVHVAPDPFPEPAPTVALGVPTPSVSVVEATVVEAPIFVEPANLRSVRITTSLGVGGVFSSSQLLPSAGAAFALGVQVSTVVVRATVGGYLLSPDVAVSSGCSMPHPPVPMGLGLETGTLHSRMLDLTVDASFVRRVASSPMFLGVGGGLSATQVVLRASSSDVFDVQGGRTTAWTAVPFLRAEVALELTSRWRLRADTRLGVFAREIAIWLPGEDLDARGLRLSGWVVNTSLSLEMQWGA